MPQRQRSAIGADRQRPESQNLRNIPGNPIGASVRRVRWFDKAAGMEQARAYGPGKETAHLMLLPIGCFHNGGNGRAFWIAQHREHRLLFGRRGRRCLQFGLRM